MTSADRLPAAAPARTADLFAPGLRGLSIGLISTITLVALESLAIGTVMPIVADELGNRQLYGWVYTAFFLGNLLGVVLAGGALDRMPLHRPFAAGLVLFGAGLLIGGLAPSMPILVLARFIQGLGGGAVGPTAYVAIGRVLPERLQPRMFAMLSTAWVVPGIIGPSIAAVRRRASRLALGVPGPRPVPRRRGRARASRRSGASTPRCPRPSTRPRTRRSAASPNALLAAGGAGAARRGPDRRDPPLLVGGVLIGGGLLLPAYRRLTPPGTLSSRSASRRRSCCAGVMTFAFFSGDAYIPLLLQTWRGTPATLTGIVFTVTTVAWTARHLVPGAADRPRSGPRRFVGLGLRADRDRARCSRSPSCCRAVPPELAVVTWLVPGIGMGFMYSAVTLVVLRGSAAAEQGSASASLQLSDILGTALGTGRRGRDRRGRGAGRGQRPRGSRSPACSRVSLVSALLGLAREPPDRGLPRARGTPFRLR